jgi:asparagine synthase (glutamine-hydrolysing)
MSAIFGQLRFDGGEVAEADVARMGRAMATRMPDGSARFVDGAIGFGHGLMRVVREDAFDQQPLYDRERGLVLAADLRLDNREELAEALGIADAALAEMPDSAVLLHAWRAWGEPCVERLIGDFAFVVWDARARTLTMARDHIGQRHLFYHSASDRILFATEVAALWAAGVPRALLEIDFGYAIDLQSDTLLAESGFVGIHAVAGGTTMTVTDDGAVTRRQYWEVAADPRHLGQDEAYYRAAYRAVLEEAVACRVRRLDRSPGLLFSGGFDSGAIAGLAGAALATNGLALIAAGAVAAPGEGEIGDARPWMERCARDMPHLQVHYFSDWQGDMFDALDESFVRAGHSGAVYATTKLPLFATLARAGARMVMDGHGGDYTLNPRGSFALARMATDFEFRRIPREIVAHRRVSGHGWRRTIWGELVYPLLPGWLRRSWQKLRYRAVPGELDFLFTPEGLRSVVEGQRHTDVRRAASRQRGRSRAYLQSMRQWAAPPSGTVAASYGMEMTRPFHDKRVIELALAIPASLQVRDGFDRHLARVALADVYPEEFRTRRPGNDSHAPGSDRRLRAVRPKLIAAAKGLAGRPGTEALDLNRAADIFRTISEMPDGPMPSARRELNPALKTLTLAYHRQWFARTNAPPDSSEA